MPGHLVAVVGTSSVGKSAVAAVLQERLTTPHLVVGLDHFFAMFPHHWAGHPRGPGPGFWYEDTVDDDGRPRAQIRYGEAGQRLLDGQRAAVRALLDAGNDVILDEMPVDGTILPAWRRDLAGHRVWWVRLTAPLAVVEAREAGRTHGRHPGNARGHLDVADGEPFDLTIDASTRSPAEVADAILGALPLAPAPPGPPGTQASSSTPGPPPA
ncbi:phosphotransferase-like protein [Krasilnikoviella flava]|uniref:Chloramphenicol 3-O phosphotransferase n=1 Tax=Krasilnikoviella flava TaxID=526729 RepID=A0A1T5LL45_9MICO|nr:hypothetical protein [Krasilnikoviella flava]SKC76640.1 chloramphenicol 3-O phosphotransferase [Krasilnikoviella flava]